ncbi:conserved hypothetical protein [Candidatus Roizmanbacteria bacterium]|nr:conserved hypothetical protein [Candidatus Roizmanbacteria bacterium]
MIKLKNIWKEYKIDKDNTFTALKKIELTIQKREFTAIIGSSGSGKSTLMHIIGLLDRPSQGEVSIHDKNTSSLDDSEISKLRNEYVGFVFQQFHLINNLTVFENIILPARYSRKKLEYDPKEKAFELLHRFGLTDKKMYYPNKLSGGEQQRVAIARALIMNPELLLADEPTGNLDSKNGEIILDILKELNKKDNLTVIVVTHDKTVSNRARRSIQLKDGQILSN